MISMSKRSNLKEDVDNEHIEDMDIEEQPNEDFGLVENMDFEETSSHLTSTTITESENSAYVILVISPMPLRELYQGPFLM